MNVNIHSIQYFKRNLRESLFQMEPYSLKDFFIIQFNISLFHTNSWMSIDTLCSCTISNKAYYFILKFRKVVQSMTAYLQARLTFCHIIYFIFFGFFLISEEFCSSFYRGWCMASYVKGFGLPGFLCQSI